MRVSQLTDPGAFAQLLGVCIDGPEMKLSSNNLSAIKVIVLLLLLL